MNVGNQSDLFPECQEHCSCPCHEVYEVGQYIPFVVGPCGDWCLCPCHHKEDDEGEDMGKDYQNIPDGAFENIEG